MYLIISISLAVAPALFLVWYYYKQDKQKPEPKGQVINLFGIGMLATVPILILEIGMSVFKGFFNGNQLFVVFFESFIVAAFCEEYIKFLIIKKFVYRSVHFDEEMDGIIYTVVAGLGFACFENIAFVLDSSISVALVRAVTSVPLHALASGMMGYYIGRARFAADEKLEKSLLFRGVFIAIVIHGLYDFILFIQPDPANASSLLIFVLLFFVYKNLQKKLKNSLIDDRMMQRS